MKASKIFLGLLIVASSAACGGGGGGGGSDDGGSGNGGQSFTTGGGTLKRNAIDSYVNDFTIPTLTSLDDSAGALLARVETFVGAPSAENLAAARSAWVASRVPWERSEAALFGPVDFYGFDPSLDTWPVNRTDLEAVLSSSTALNDQSVANLDNALKGFHTIEYLLFGNRGEKTADQLTAREGEYLVATSRALKSITASLLASWISGYQGQPPYAQEVVSAGQGSTAFPSESSVIEQFARGVIGICDEVANGKIADPFDQRDPNIVESQFSGNSLSDFANNIGGARDAYITALSPLVVAENPALDARVRGEFERAIAAVRAIPEPFLEAIQSPSNDATIRNAQEAIRAVEQSITGEVLPLLLS